MEIIFKGKLWYGLSYNMYFWNSLLVVPSYPLPPSTITTCMHVEGAIAKL